MKGVGIWGIGSLGIGDEKIPRFASTWLSTALSTGEVGSVSRGKGLNNQKIIVLDN